MSYLTIAIFGLLAASMAVIIEIITLGAPGVTSYPISVINFSSVFSILAVASVEEGTKYLFLRQYIRRFLKDRALSLKTAALLGFAFGLGFASLEIAFILFGAPKAGMAVWPLVGILTLHTVTSILLAVVLSRSLKSRLFTPLGVLGSVIGIHILYNLAVSTFS